MEFFRDVGWNRCEGSLERFWEILELEKIVVHGSEELLHSCSPGEAYCSSYCLQLCSRFILRLSQACQEA